MPTETNREISQQLDGMKIEDTTVFVRPEKEHRVAVIFRGKDLSDRLTDSDPQVVGEKPRGRWSRREPGAARSARVVNAFLDEVAARIGARRDANRLLLEGLRQAPEPAGLRRALQDAGLRHRLLSDVQGAGAGWSG